MHTMSVSHYKESVCQSMNLNGKGVHLPHGVIPRPVFFLFFKLILTAIFLSLFSSFLISLSLPFPLPYLLPFWE